MTATILFDFDGVIVDSIEIFSNAVNAAGNELRQPVVFFPEDLRSIRYMSIPEIVKKANVDPALTDQFIAGIDKFLLNRTNEFSVFPDMPVVLKELSRLAHIGIVSATPVAVISKVIDNHSLTEYIDIIAGGDQPGSKAKKINAIRESNDSPVNKTCIVGDTVSDIEQGKLAGVTTVAVNWGWHSAEWIRRFSPNFEAKTPLDLLDLIVKKIIGSNITQSIQKVK